MAAAVGELDGSPYVNIDPGQLAALLEDGGYYLVNVHVPDEGEIPGTDVHIPFDDVEAHVDLLPTDRTSPIVLYCRSGRMSRIAADTLASLGYTNLLHLDGGMIAWQDASYPLDGVPE